MAARTPRYKHPDLAQRVSERIRSARLELGLTQTELALRCSTDRKTVSRWESAKSLPSASAIAALKGHGIDLSAEFAAIGGSAPIATASATPGIRSAIARRLRCFADFLDRP
jgi:transcriptional regulator with XRE-family HTH domain